MLNLSIIYLHVSVTPELLYRDKTAARKGSISMGMFGKGRLYVDGILIWIRMEV